MTISWDRIFWYYNDLPKLEKVKKKIYFLFTCVFCMEYIYFIITKNYVDIFDLYLLIFSLFFNVVTLFTLVVCKTTKLPIIISSFNDITNTSLAIWFTGGPYSLDIYWYFTLILGLIVLVETRMGFIVAIIAFVNIVAVFIAEYNHWCNFREDSLKISFQANAINLISVFIVLVLIVIFVTQKDLYEEEIITEKDNNIFNLEAELELKLAEINNIRTDIARDFHDVMGNKLASITNISQMLNIKNEKYKELNDELSRINSLSKELYEGTKDFIWAMDNANNTLHSVYFYVKDFGEKLFEYSNINFLTQPLSAEIEDYNVSSLWSSQFILISKEILTNAMVHSKASDVKMDIAYNSINQLVISFHDNGVGFDINNLQRKNGLHNILKRAEAIGCKLNIVSENTKGTNIEIII